MTVDQYARKWRFGRRATKRPVREGVVAVLTWAGGTCDTGHELVINVDGRTLRMFRQACQGDTLGGVGHLRRLTFDAPAPAAEFDVTLETTP